MAVCLKVIVPIVATCLTLVPLESSAVGCPNGPDHWFNVAIKLDPHTLPRGVAAESRSEQAGTGIFLKNSTAIPLIINPPVDLASATSIPSPDSSKTYQGAYPRPLTLKLVSDEGYFCDGQEPLRCDMDIRVNKDNALLDTPEIRKAINAGWVAKDDRPQGVKIPSPQTFEFLALYGDTRIPLKGTVTFSLNPAYDSKLGEKSKERCAEASHREWYTCRSDRECVIVAGDCGVEWAANKSFAAQTRTDPPRSDTVCTKPLESHPANTVATCENATCGLSPPGFYAGGAPIPRQ